MAVLTMASTTACTGTDVLTAAVIIGAAVAAPNDHRPIGRGHVRRDRNDHRQDHRGHRNDGRIDRRPRHRNMFALQVAATPESFKSSDARVVKIADKYEITDYAATYIARAIILAEQKDLSGVKEMGLSLKDLQKVYKGKEIETSKLEAVSEKLVLSRGDTQRLLKEMSEDIQVEKTARGL